VGAHVLDRLIGDELPWFRTDEELRAFESIPWPSRVAAASTLEAIARGAALDPKAPALTFLPNADPADAPFVVTHEQFLARVTQAANAFHELGVGPGDVVSFLLPLLPQSFYALFGAEAAGIANPVNPLLEAHQIAEILEAAGTKVLVCLGPVAGSDIWAKVERIRPRLAKLKAVVQVRGEGRGGLELDALVAAQPSDRLVSDRRIAQGDIAAYFHTGGTTGTPKLVRHTHANQVYQAWVCALMLRSTPGRSLLFGLPLFHVGGALTQGLATFASGGNAVVLSPAGWRNANAVKNVWKLVERFRPEIFGGVPTVLAAAMTVPLAGEDISSVKCTSGGGSAIPVAVGEALAKFFHAPVLEVYGMTETASVHTIAYMGRDVVLGSVGRAVPYSRVRVVKLDAQGRDAGDCAVDEIGVVAMSGPGVFSGYVNDEHNRSAFVAPGWVNSGDLGRLDAHGDLWITGRAKDLIIRGAHNIDPQPIEELLFRHPDVALAAVVGQPDAYAGELPVAYVQAKPGAQPDAAALLAYLRDGAPERAAVPVAIHFLDALPLTAVGKVFKPRLRWDAAERVFAEALATIANRGVDLSVSVGAHGTHGSLATVTVRGVPPEGRETVEREVKERLAPFVMRHAIDWT
jgi:fatty-acyl-CoA synthase